MARMRNPVHPEARNNPVQTIEEPGVQRRVLLAPDDERLDVNRARWPLPADSESGVRAIVVECCRERAGTREPIDVSIDVFLAEGSPPRRIASKHVPHD